MTSLTSIVCVALLAATHSVAGAPTIRQTQNQATSAWNSAISSYSSPSAVTNTNGVSNPGVQELSTQQCLTWFPDLGNLQPSAPAVQPTPTPAQQPVQPATPAPQPTQQPTQPAACDTTAQNWVTLCKACATNPSASPSCSTYPAATFNQYCQIARSKCGVTGRRRQTSPTQPGGAPATGGSSTTISPTPEMRALCVQLLQVTPRSSSQPNSAPINPQQANPAPAVAGTQQQQQQQQQQPTVGMDSTGSLSLFQCQSQYATTIKQIQALATQQQQAALASLATTNQAAAYCIQVLLSQPQNGRPFLK